MCPKLLSPAWLSLLPLPQVHQVLFFHWSFAHAVPSVWNTHPDPSLPVFLLVNAILPADRSSKVTSLAKSFWCPHWVTLFHRQPSSYLLSFGGWSFIITCVVVWWLPLLLIIWEVHTYHCGPNSKGNIWYQVGAQTLLLNKWSYHTPTWVCEEDKPIPKVNDRLRPLQWRIKWSREWMLSLSRDQCPPDSSGLLPSAPGRSMVRSSEGVSVGGWTGLMKRDWEEKLSQILSSWVAGLEFSLVAPWYTVMAGKARLSLEMGYLHKELWAPTLSPWGRGRACLEKVIPNSALSRPPAWCNLFCN